MYKKDTKINDICTQNEINVVLNQLDEFISRAIKGNRIPGAAIAIIDNGEIRHMKGYGLADKKQNIPVTPETCFQVGSISKTLTAWGIMKLAENGKLALDVPVESYLSRWRLPESAFKSDMVTVGRVLSHTAGLSVKGYSGIKGNGSLCSLEESLAGVKNPKTAVGIIQEPGSSFLYSGGGYTVLQLLIEEITGRTFSDYMEDEILKPLGMLDSTFSSDTRTRSHMAKAYGVFGNTLPDYTYSEKAAAGLITTISDLSRFLLANIELYNGASNLNVLKKESIIMMQSRINRAINYGLGYKVLNLPGKNKALYHGGINNGWRSKFVLLPNKKSGIIIMTNSNNGSLLISEAIRRWLESIVGPLTDFYLKAIKINKTSKLRNIMDNVSLFMHYT